MKATIIFILYLKKWFSNFDNCYDNGSLLWVLKITILRVTAHRRTKWMKSGKHWGTVFSSQMNLLNLDTVPQQHIFPCHGPVLSLCFTCGIKNIFMNTINAQLAISSKKGVGSIYNYIYNTMIRILCDC